MSKEIKSVIKKILPKESSKWDNFIGKVYEKIKEHFILIILIKENKLRINTFKCII